MTPTRDSRFAHLDHRPGSAVVLVEDASTAPQAWADVGHALRQSGRCVAVLPAPPEPTDGRHQSRRALVDDLAELLDVLEPQHHDPISLVARDKSATTILTYLAQHPSPRIGQAALIDPVPGHTPSWSDESTAEGPVGVRRIRIPILVAVGSQTGTAWGSQLVDDGANLLSHPTLRIYPQFGLALAAPRPEELIADLLDFLGEAAPAPPAPGPPDTPLHT